VFGEHHDASRPSCIGKEAGADADHSVEGVTHARSLR
jgi:hypothetical protein